MNSTVKLLEEKPLSDEELAASARAGSRRSFEKLVCRYSQRIFLFLRAKIPTDQDTEDLVQETFLKAYRNIDRFDHNYRFSTWLYTTAARLAISYWRKKQMSELTGESACPMPGPQETMIQRERFENLWDAARALHKSQFQALWLRYAEDMPIKEVARVMKRTQIHVRVLLHRARLNLVDQVSRFHGSAMPHLKKGT